MQKKIVRIRWYGRYRLLKILPTDKASKEQANYEINWAVKAS
jgi:hypothetical protein